MTKLQRPEALSLAQQLELAAKALVDPRTVARYARGERVRGLSAERIRLAAVKLGLRLAEASP